MRMKQISVKDLKKQFLKSYKELNRLLKQVTVSKEEEDFILDKARNTLYQAQLDHLNPSEALGLPEVDYLIRQSTAYRRKLQPRKLLHLVLKVFLFGSIALWIYMKWLAKSSYSDFFMGLALIFVGLHHLESQWTPFSKLKKSTIFYRVLVGFILVSSSILMIGTLLGWNRF